MLAFGDFSTSSEEDRTMRARGVVVASVVSALMVFGLAPAQAQSAGAIFGGLAGGVLGG